jgi:Glycosyl transferase family 2
MEESVLQDLTSLSIVVEWENAKNSDFQRGRAMLSVLIDQLQSLSRARAAAFELILVYDGDEASVETIIASLQDITTRFPGTVTMAPCHGLDYYQQKNFGAQRAKYESILFVDCDIVPCPGWLQNLLDCYVEEGADVVGGATHMETRSLYEKAFAVFWFFPLASEVHQRGPASYFYANNVIFRADVFKNMPYPDSNLVRGQCVLLARKLLAHHHSIYSEPSAKVLHPPPNGLRHYIKRALCAGQDRVAGEAPLGLSGAFRQCYWEIRKAVKRIVAHRREVELSPLGVVGAMGIGASYFGLEFVGQVISFMNPNLLREKFRV